MPVDKEGNRILKEAGYRKFKDLILKSVAERIRDDPTPGQDIGEIVGRVMASEKFEDFYSDLVEETKAETELDEEGAKESAKIILGEKAVEEILERTPGLMGIEDGFQVEEVPEELKGEKILEGKYSRKTVGTRFYRTGFWRFLERHSLMIVIIGAGGIMIILSAFLLNSIYDALVAALTLNAVSTTDLWKKLGNIIGAFGGVILFFTTVSLAISHILERGREKERISKLAEDFLKEREAKEKESSSNVSR